MKCIIKAKASILKSVIAFVLPGICISSSPAMASEEIVLAKPTAKQNAFADWEVGAFIHYGLNVYTGQEHGDGKEPPSKFCTFTIIASPILIG